MDVCACVLAFKELAIDAIFNLLFIVFDPYGGSLLFIVFLMHMEAV